MTSATWSWKDKGGASSWKSHTYFFWGNFTSKMAYHTKQIRRQCTYTDQRKKQLNSILFLLFLNSFSQVGRARYTYYCQQSCQTGQNSYQASPVTCLLLQTLLLSQRIVTFLKFVIDVPFHIVCIFHTWLMIPNDSSQLHIELEASLRRSQRQYLLTLGSVQNGPLPSSARKVDIFIYWKQTAVRFRFQDWGLLPKNKNFPGLQMMAKANRSLEILSIHCELAA